MFISAMSTRQKKNTTLLDALKTMVYDDVVELWINERSLITIKASKRGIHLINVFNDR